MIVPTTVMRRPVLFGLRAHMTQTQSSSRSFRTRSATSPICVERPRARVVVVIWCLAGKEHEPMKEIRARATPDLGASVLATVAIGYVVLWVVARPPHEPTARYIGEICGAEALLLFSSSLVLATFLRPIERAFSGLDRVVVWHRHAATWPSCSSSRTSRSLRRR
jgi:hypothetical protein